MTHLQVGALQRVAEGLKTKMVLKVANILVDEDWAVVELRAENGIAKQGWVFDNKYCWICRFDKVYCPGLCWLYCRPGCPSCSQANKALVTRGLNLLQGVIVEARAYLDSAMVARLITESETS